MMMSINSHILKSEFPFKILTRVLFPVMLLKVVTQSFATVSEKFAASIIRV
jgi:hypothetical protein